MNKRHIFYSFPVILLLITLIANWFATDYISKKVSQEIKRADSASDRYNSALGASVSYLMDADGDRGILQP